MNPPDSDAVRELLRRAVLTLAAIPDPDIRFRLGPRTAWPVYVRETRDAYASAPPKVRLFQPSAEDLSHFLDWLAWLDWYGREKSQQTARLFVAWAFGAPMWMLQQRCDTNRRVPASPNTVRARLDEMVAEIAARAFDKLRELPQKTRSERYGPNYDASDLRILPQSPKKWISPDGIPFGPDHPDAIAARKADREAARTRAKHNRKYAKAKRA